MTKTCVILLAALVLVPTRSHAEKIVWAKGARHFGNECPPSNSHCILAFVRSPNGRDAAEVSVTKDVPSVRIFEEGRSYPMKWDFDTEVPFVEMEILWSPDSTAVSFAWNESAITQKSRIYTLKANGPKLVDLQTVLTDLSDAYPPCVGDPDPCRLSKSGEDYNYLTVAWAAPHTIVLMGEVPGSAGFGSNMSQVKGYELDTMTGKIVHVMTPEEFKRRWQYRMGWNFRIPDKP